MPVRCVPRSDEHTFVNKRCPSFISFPRLALVAGVGGSPALRELSTTLCAAFLSREEECDVADLWLVSPKHLDAHGRDSGISCHAPV